MSGSDFDELVGVLLPQAKLFLSQFGEFFPFAASVNQDGTLGSVGAFDGREHPRSKEVIDHLVDGLRDQASRREIRAVGICYDVRVMWPSQSTHTDAIQIALESSDGKARYLFYPYRKGWFGRFRYGAPFGQAAEKRVFAGNPS